MDMDEFPTMLQQTNEFLWEPYTAVVDRQVFERQWDANVCSWNKKISE